MAKSLIFKILKKGAKIKKTWKNVFALRQEYNKYQQAWFPVIFYWNRMEETTPDGTTRFRCWVECLCTETGSSYYHDEAKADYTSISRPGTDKCNPEHVKAIVKHYQAECDENDPCGPVQEVKKLGAYMPKAPWNRK